MLPLVWKPIETAPKDGTRILAHNFIHDAVQIIHFVRGVPIPVKLKTPHDGWLLDGSSRGWSYLIQDEYDLWAEIPTVVP